MLINFGYKDTLFFLLYIPFYIEIFNKYKNILYYDTVSYPSRRSISDCLKIVSMFLPSGV